MLKKGEGISINESLAVHYYKSSADHGNAVAQRNYGIMLSKGEGVSITKSCAVH
jgi:TPR repeat protein